MIITDVDAWLKSHLEKIELVTAETSVRVYEYLPDRDAGETKPPCIAFERLEFAERKHDSRPDHEYFIPSEEEETIQVPDDMGGGELTGPVEYTRKPWPIPIDLVYEIDTLATRKADADALQQMILIALQSGKQYKIGDQYGLVILDDPANLDDLSRPLYRTAYTFTVTGLYVERPENWIHPSIIEITLGTDPSLTSGD